jgi:tRNA (guanine-N7-)-methyltransferase
VGADRPGGPTQDRLRLTAPPIGQVYGRRRSRPLKGKRATAFESGLDARAISLPDDAGTLDPRSLFAPAATSVWLEIGFGGGEHLAAQARAHPETGFIGCEPFTNGVSSLLVLLDEGCQSNVRVFADDARLLLRALIPGSIARAFLLFPDPWPKRRHQDRRFVTPEGLDLVARALADGAEFRVATDHPVLQSWIPKHIEAHSAFQLETRAEARPETWPPTRYEAKALAAGRQPVYLVYRRRSRNRNAGSNV